MTTATIRLVLERDFESFGADQRHLLIDDIANLLGCNTDELKNVRFRRGCVILEFEVHEEIAEWFVRLAKKAETGADLTEELEAIKECFKRHGIAGVNIERKVRFAIERRDNTPQREIALIHGWNDSSESFGQLPKILKSKFYVDHTGIVKPEDENSEIVKTLIRFMMGFGRQ